METDKDLFLKFTFTDRGGKRVYDVYTQCDHMTMQYRIGEVRIDSDDFDKDDEQECTGNGTG